MRRTFVLVMSSIVLLLSSSTAMAGKAERDLKKKIESGTLKEANATVKEACGCSELAVDWKAFKVVEEMAEIARELEYAAKTVSKFCKSDAESKKLYCQNVSTIQVSFIDKSSPETVKKGKTIVIKTTKGMNSGGFKLKEIIEEF